MSDMKILVMSGDGVGEEVTSAAVAVLCEVARKFQLGLSLQTAVIGFKSLERVGTTFPESVLDAARGCDGIILGPVSHNAYPPVSQGGANPSAELRKWLALYANIRPARSRPGLLPAFGKPIDLVIVRENTEGAYADRCMHEGPGELVVAPGVAIAMRRITRTASIRIAETAFRMALRRNHHVTAVHKSNVLRVTDGLYLECVRETASRYPGVRYDEQLVDAMAALLVRDPGMFDVIVTPNMFGDILSDEASEIAGSIGMAESLNVGDRYLMAQAQHGSAPDIADKDIVNPCSLIGSTAMMLELLGQRRGEEALVQAGHVIHRSIDLQIAKPSGRTRDLGGVLGTTRFVRELVDMIRAQ